MSWAVRGGRLIALRWIGVLGALVVAGCGGGRAGEGSGADAMADAIAADATVSDAAVGDAMGGMVDAMGGAADAMGGTSDAMPDAIVDATAPDAARPPPLPYAEHPLLGLGPLVIAHRGGRRLAPENTLPAFEAALAAGADVLEMDVHATADGALVVMHDHTVDRTTDGMGEIAALRLDEIRALDAGYGFSPDRGETFPWRGRGVRVPTFDEVLAAFPAVPLTVEIKPTDPAVVPLVVAALDRAGARGRVAIGALDVGVMQAFRAAAPDVATGMALPEVVAWITLPPGPMARVWDPPGHVFQVPMAQAGFELVTAATVAHAHRHGVVMHVWTINDAETMGALLDLGVDGIMTDDPALLRAVVDGR